MAFCSGCGEKMGDDIRFCPKCGTAIESATVLAAKSSELMRHTFTTVWLILGIIYYSIGAFSQLFVVDASLSLSFSMRMFIMFACMGQAVSVFFILKWKKIAFWGFLGASAISVIIQIIGLSEIINKLQGEYAEDLINASSSIGVIFAVIYIFSFWGVLQIRKNGKSAWSQLE